MNLRAITLTVLTFVLATIVMTIIKAHPNQPQTPSSLPKKEQKDFRESVRQKVGEPTTVQEGAMTEKQKKRGKLFKRFESATQGKKLRDLSPELNEVYVVKSIGMVLRPRSFNLHEYLQSLTCRSDAVVVGTVKSKASNVIDEGTFLFTDYEITVDEILKNNATSPIQPNSDITYTSTGGSVKLNGRIIRAIDEANEPLEIGKRYLLYLRFIPETGSYRGFVDDLDSDTYEINGNQIIQASGKPLPLGTRRFTDAAPFITEVRAAIGQSCNN